jgi:hypothetical protein
MQMSVQEATNEQLRRIREHDKPEIDQLLLTAGEPDRNGLRYPAEELLVASLLNESATAIQVRYIRGIWLHMWGAGACVDLPLSRNEDPQVRAVREGRVELPRPFGHRILRMVRPGTDPGATCRPVSSRAVLCHPVSFRREQAVSKMVAIGLQRLTWSKIGGSRWQPSSSLWFASSFSPARGRLRLQGSPRQPSEPPRDGQAEPEQNEARNYPWQGAMPLPIRDQDPEPLEVALVLVGSHSQPRPA